MVLLPGAMRTPAILLCLAALSLPVGLSSCHHGMPPDQAAANLQSPDPTLRRNAADSLHAESNAPAAVVGNLLNAVQTEQVPNVRGAMLIALGTWGSPQAKPIIDQAVATAADPDQQRWAGRALHYWMIQTGAMDKAAPLPPHWPYGQPGFPPALVK
jgi:hypothetical protein